MHFEYSFAAHYLRVSGTVSPLMFVSKQMSVATKGLVCWWRRYGWIISPTSIEWEELLWVAAFVKDIGFDGYIASEDHWL